MSDHAAIVRDEAEKISSILSYEPTPFQLEQAVNFLAVIVIREIDALVAERDEWRSKYYAENTNWTSMYEEARAAEAERDEARAERDHWSKSALADRTRTAEARVTELEAALRHISELRDPGTAEVAKLFWHAKDHARAALAAKEGT